MSKKDSFIDDFLQDSDERLTHLSIENNMLIDIIHDQQKKMEEFYFKLKDKYELNQHELHKRLYTSMKEINNSDYNKIVERLANLKYFVDCTTVQKMILKAERENSIAVALYNILLDGITSVRNFFRLPFRLAAFWWTSERTIPPVEWGGDSYSKAIEVYNREGLDALNILLNGVSVSFAMRANAYTAVARSIQNKDSHKAFQLAKLAYMQDPKPYRLEWLAFRAFDDGQYCFAEVCLDMLDKGKFITDSKRRKCAEIHKKSFEKRKRYALRECICLTKLIELRTAIDNK